MHFENSPSTEKAARRSQKWGLPSAKRLALSFGCFSLITACGDPIKVPQVIENPRVLGVSIRSESGRSWPRSDEQAEVTILVAGPEGPIETRVEYRVCAALDSSSGVPLCSETWASGTTVVSTEPGFSFVGKRGDSARQRVAIWGVACETGKPELAQDPFDWSCSDDSSPIRFSFETTTEAADDDNPVLDATTVDLDGTSLALEPSNVTASCDDDASRLHLGERASLGFSLDPKARSLPDEVLQISHFATQGTFERQYTIVDADEPLDFELEFEAPDRTGPVKAYLVVRDERGNTSWLSFSLCIVE